MASKNPWEKIKHLASEIVPPVMVLREQATLLGEATGGVVQGRVESDRNSRYLTHMLQAVVPTMNYYAVNLLEIRHEATLYPVFVIAPWKTMPQVKCDNVDNLATVVADLLSSGEVQNIVASLLAQASQA